jgi:hypothetical protein
MSKKRKNSAPSGGSQPDETYERGNTKNLYLDQEIKALPNLSIKKDGKEVPVNVQISDYLKAMKLIESETLLRMYIGNHLFCTGKKLNEDLTRSDKAEIKRIARREIEDMYRDELKQKVTKEVEKLLGGKKNQDIIVDVTKKVLRKFYRELAFNYTPAISRLKI